MNLELAHEDKQQLIKLKLVLGSSKLMMLSSSKEET